MIAGAVYERLAQYDSQRRYPAPGMMVDAGGYRVQIDCRGSGSPTVVFESGLNMAGSVDWAMVQPEVARHARACSYSRAGMMWSDPAPQPQSADSIARTLHVALQSSGEKAPFVFVAHSVGGPYAMTFTRLFGPEVAGLVLVDATHPDQIKRFASLSQKTPPPTLRWSAALRDLGVARAMAPILVPSMAERTDQQTQAIRGYVSRSVETLAYEINSIDDTLAQAGKLRQLNDRPLIVLTALQPYSDAELKSMRISAERGKDVQAIWVELQAEQARWSNRGEHRLLPGAGHNIQLDAPSEVVDATLRVVDLARKDASAMSPGRH